MIDIIFDPIGDRLVFGIVSKCKYRDIRNRVCRLFQYLVNMTQNQASLPFIYYFQFNCECKFNGSDVCRHVDFQYHEKCASGILYVINERKSAEKELAELHCTINKIGDDLSSTSLTYEDNGSDPELIDKEVGYILNLLCEYDDTADKINRVRDKLNELNQCITGLMAEEGIPSKTP